jgi:hypothetical protein
MSDEILNRIEKHMEGTQLGLAALSEVLQKMDERMEAEESASYELAKEEEEALEKEELISDIAKAVMIELSDQGMDVDGTDIENVGKPDPTSGATAEPNYIGDADDSSETVEPRTDISEQQASIMAEDDDEDEDEEKAMHGDDDDDDDKEKAMMPKKEKAEDDDDDDDDEEEKAMMGGMKAMKKALASLQKQIDAMDISKAVKEESETRLRKMGCLY